MRISPYFSLAVWKPIENRTVEFYINGEIGSETADEYKGYPVENRPSPKIHVGKSPRTLEPMGQGLVSGCQYPVTPNKAEGEMQCAHSNTS
jgi:hypothetical protein